MKRHGRGVYAHLDDHHVRNRFTPGAYTRDSALWRQERFWVSLGLGQWHPRQLPLSLRGNAHETYNYTGFCNITSDAGDRGRPESVLDAAVPTTTQATELPAAAPIQSVRPVRDPAVHSVVRPDASAEKRHAAPGAS